jgi:hypothetical protein
LRVDKLLPCDKSSEEEAPARMAVLPEHGHRRLDPVSEHRIAHPAQQDSVGDGARGQVYLYPHPLTLARDHAEAERIRLADSAAYSSMAATWGRLGGLSTFYRYGREHFRLLALHRWGNATALADLTARMERRRP